MRYQSTTLSPHIFSHLSVAAGGEGIIQHFNSCLTQAALNTRTSLLSPLSPVKPHFMLEVPMEHPQNQVLAGVNTLCWGSGRDGSSGRSQPAQPAQALMGCTLYQDSFIPWPQIEPWALEKFPSWWCPEPCPQCSPGALEWELPLGWSVPAERLLRQSSTLSHKMFL